MYLADTNIFLEILLKQEKSELCKNFLKNNFESLNISDFTLHSIGVILFRQKEENLFLNFIEDMFSHIDVKSLPKENYKEIVEVKRKHNLDFDDAYQLSISKTYELKLITMDQDFKGIDEIKVQFL